LISYLCSWFMGDLSRSKIGFKKNLSLASFFFFSTFLYLEYYMIVKLIAFCQYNLYKCSFWLRCELNWNKFHFVYYALDVLSLYIKPVNKKQNMLKILFDKTNTTWGEKQKNLSWIILWSVISLSLESYLTFEMAINNIQ